MFEKFINFSLENKLLVILAVIALILMGIFSAGKIPLDAVPDITNNQVQIVSTAPTLAPQEVEQLITYPLESAMTNIPGVLEVRSISRYGLSVITIVFEESIPVMLARQYVQEQLNIAKSELAEGLTEPELMPITTGLGEIYQYVLTVDKAYAHLYDATELRTIQDWVVKRQLNGTKGVIEVSSFGGYLKQYEVALKPEMLKTYDLSIPNVIKALEENNQNSGGSYIENGPYSYYIRTEGRVTDIKSIENILVKNQADIPIKIGDIATVGIGSAKRYGAMTMDGKGEVVGGITLMFKGANSSEVLSNVKERMEEVSKTLPEGIAIYPYLDRSKLIGRTINTVKTNLIEGGLIVIFVLLLLLGNFRAGLIVASVIPLSMLFALTMMRYFGISANLMSLGAIDFGIVIDGAVIIVESLLHSLTLGYIGQKLTQKKMDEVVSTSTSKIYRSAVFGVLIILVVFVPILTLEGTEGKTFRPMAQTVGFAILGSLLLSITYVPVMASLFLNKKIKSTLNWADRMINYLKKLYQPILKLALMIPLWAIGSTLVVFFFTIVLFSKLGAEFVPTLEEGDIAMQQSIKPGSSLVASIQSSTQAEQILLDNFPEVEHVVSKIGTAEVPTDPMAIEDADIMIILKDKKEWTSAKTREDLMRKMKEKLAPITWASYEFTQPIQLRFNELMTGAKSDISVKIFGEDVEILKSKADEAASIIQNIQGAGDVKVDQTEGLQQLSIKYNRERLAQYGIPVAEVNQVIRAAYAGEPVGNIFEQERKFDLVARIGKKYRQELDLSKLTIHSVSGQSVPLNQIAEIVKKEGPMLISREQARRFINIGINVRERDISSLVTEIQSQLNSQLELPPAYEIQYGGQFENLENAKKRLLVAVPMALALILLLLYLAFKSIIDALIIFIAVPLSAVGGVLALWIRGMPFSISSGIGFIALFGVSVLNGIVLLSAIRQLDFSEFTKFEELINSACQSRLRPVLMTALVAALGFLPMAISTGSGAEVQRPLATVVIGGLITSTLLTLILLPTLYYMIYKKSWMKKTMILLIGFMMIGTGISSQDKTSFDEVWEHARVNHPILKNYELTQEKTMLEKNSINPWGSLDIKYRGGQINYSGYDQEFSANLDISPLLRSKLKKKEHTWIENKVMVLIAEKDLVQKDLKTRLQLLFNELDYHFTMTELMEEIQSLYQDLEDKMQLRYDEGEIDLVSLEFFKNELVNTTREKEAFDQMTNRIEGDIRKLAVLGDSIEINRQTLSQINASVHAFQEKNNTQLEIFQRKKGLLESEAGYKKMQSRQLDWNMGYFAQSLEKDFLFQGFVMGIGIPFDQRENKVMLQQIEIEKEKLDNEMSLLSQKFGQTIKTINDQKLYLQETITDFESNTLSKLDLILEKSKLKLEQGAIDIFTFNNIQERLLKQRIDYLDWIRDYNELVIQLLFITQKN